MYKLHWQLFRKSLTNLFKMVVKIGDKSVETPTKPGQVKLSQALSFLETYEAYNKIALQIESDDEMANDFLLQKKLLIEMGKSVAAFFDIPFSSFMNEKLVIKITDEQEINEALTNINILFQHLSSVIATYKPKLKTPEDFIFNYKGQAYALPLYLVNDELYDQPITVAQSIESLEVKRLTARHINTNWKNAYYTELVSLIAIFARKVDSDGDYESFPEEQNQIDDFIEKRKKLFLDIDMVNAFDCSFFLISFMKDLGKDQTIDTFLNPHNINQKINMKLRPTVKL